MWKCIICVATVHVTGTCTVHVHEGDALDRSGFQFSQIRQ